MKTHDDVRQSVSENYAQAVKRTSESCCSGTPTNTQWVELAGYDAQGVQDVPAEAVASSFGCGNPLAFSGVEAGETVLDLGSGAGIDLIIAAGKVGPDGQVIGVDMTDEMIAKARENVAAAGHNNVDVRKGIIEDLPVESGTVDWVISNCVINLSPEKPKVFAEIARVLKPGGRMLVSDIVVDDLPMSVRQNEAMYNSCVAGAISETEYLDGLRQAGMDEVDVRHRTVYDASQLRGFLKCDAGEGDPAIAEWVASLDPEEARSMPETLEGRIWSASIYARKA